MAISPLAGKLPPADLLIRTDEIIRAYYDRQPDLSDGSQRVSFGTSGHRGAPLEGSFNEAHILAMTQAICEYRSAKGSAGPLFLARDTHAADTPAHNTALEVLAANGVDTIIAADEEFTPVPVLSHAILTFNRGRTSGLADGIAVTPSHNPPRDGGFKYNPPEGGPADVEATGWIQVRANALLREGNREVKRVSFERAQAAPSTYRKNLIGPYVEDLGDVVDMEVIRSSGIRIGADPLGGASVHLWYPIRERYGIDVTVVNPIVDSTFRFMRVDHDGQIRMDCSSPYAMAGLVDLKDRYQISFGNDTDADRHGIVAPSTGLLPPNHFLATAVRYLFSHRPGWPPGAMVGKTLVSSSIIDSVAASQNRQVFEVPVGFKWFVQGLYEGRLGFAGEESAGATFLRKNGSVWTTDKDGPVMDLIACEMTARTGKDPGQLYAEIEQQFGRSYYRREDQAATAEEKRALGQLSPSAVHQSSVAGEPIVSVLTRAPGNQSPIGGIKVVTKDGWFAARPSGTEDVYKIYAESLKSEEHLNRIFEDARGLVRDTLTASAR